MIIRRNNRPRAQYADYGQTHTFRIGYHPRGGGGMRRLWLILLAIGMVSIGMHRGWFTNGIIPWPNGMGKPSASSPVMSPQPQDASAFADLVTGEIALEPMSCYCVQIAYFRDRENAEEMASARETDGAGGYIWQDGDRYRVLDTASLSRDAAQMRASVLRDAGIAEPCLTRQSIPGSRLTVTAGADTLGILRDAVMGISDTAQAWMEWVEAYDAGEKDAAALAEEIAGQGSRLSAWRDALAALPGAQDPSGTMAAAAKAIGSMLQAGEEVLAYGNQNTLAFSKELRYNQMEVLYCYNIFMTEINPPS